MGSDYLRLVIVPTCVANWTWSWSKGTQQPARTYRRNLKKEALRGWWICTVSFSARFRDEILEITRYAFGGGFASGISCFLALKVICPPWGIYSSLILY